MLDENDWTDEELMLRRGQRLLDDWQAGTSFATWRAMQPRKSSPLDAKAYAIKS